LLGALFRWKFDRHLSGRDISMYYLSKWNLRSVLFCFGHFFFMFLEIFFLQLPCWVRSRASPS
jgi:hypothetical protein